METPELHRTENQESGEEIKVVINGVLELFKNKAEYRRWLQQQLEENNA